MAMLNITRSGIGYFANFRNYSRFADNCILGIAVGDNKVIKQNVICNRTSGYDFRLGRDFDINSNIGCVLIEDNKANMPIVWGADNSKVGYMGKVLEYIDSVGRDGVTKNNVGNSCVEDVSDYSKSHKTNFSKEIIGIKNIEKELVLDDCKESEKPNPDNLVIEDELCKENSVDADIDCNNTEVIKNALQYNENDEKKANLCGETYRIRDNDIESMSMAKESIFEDGDIEQEINNAIVGEDGNFYDMIAEQIDALFQNYPNEEMLESIVPNSKWVKVNYEGSENTYVVGLLYELEVVKYVAYGVPGKGIDNVPESLDGYSQWIPLDPKSPDKDGYFVMFQDAETGESIKQVNNESMK